MERLDDLANDQALNDFLDRVAWIVAGMIVLAIIGLAMVGLAWGGGL